MNDAKGFVNRAAMRKVKMLWDATGQSWNYWGVPGKPAAILVNASGVVVKTWTGELDKNAILAAAGKV